MPEGLRVVGIKEQGLQTEQLVSSERKREIISQEQKSGRKMRQMSAQQ